jgi:threonine synthase
MGDRTGTTARFFQRRVGRTPLLRARGLERHLGLEEVHFKLEGINPTGHKCDRISYSLARDAHERGFRTLTVGTTGYFARSLGHIAPSMGVRCVFYVPTVVDGLNEELARMEGVGVERVEGTLDDAVARSRARAAGKGWYDANPGLSNTIMAAMAYSPISSEVVSRLGAGPSSVSVPLGSGSLLSGVHAGFRQLWSTEAVRVLPVMFAGSIEGGNAIVESFHRGLAHVDPLSGPPPRVRGALQALVNASGVMGQQGIDALYDTGGRAYGIHARELRELARLARSLDGVSMSADSAAALGALVRAHEEGLLKDGGSHVVVLSTGRTDLTIQEIGRRDLEGKLDRTIELLDGWLNAFSDPKEEIREALENALDKGHVLGAFLDGRLVGICALSRMELDTFFPRFHLSYIAADDRYEGRGVATMLIQRAIEVSGGRLSLHVETDNKKAVSLYRKMGFDTKYYRMLYRGGPGGPGT